MKEKENKSFYLKLYIIFTLSAIIIVGLIYLIGSGSTSIIENKMKPQSTSTPVAVHTPEPSVTPSALPSSTPTPTEAPVDVTSDDSIWRIVNKTHMISPDYVPSDLVQPNVLTNETQLLRKEAADALEQMFQAASDEGISLYLISGYRDYQLQTSLYNTYVARMGSEQAARIDDHPGASEHQIGLAADLGTADHVCELNGCFSTTQAYQWLVSHSYEYGWILRYPEGKEDVTGIMYSPWNFRYVGTEEAQKLYESGLTMEEYYHIQ